MIHVPALKGLFQWDSLFSWIHLVQSHTSLLWQRFFIFQGANHQSSTLALKSTILQQFTEKYWPVNSAIKYSPINFCVHSLKHPSIHSGSLIAFISTHPPHLFIYPSVQTSLSTLIHLFVCCREHMTQTEPVMCRGGKEGQIRWEESEMEGNCWKVVCFCARYLENTEDRWGWLGNCLTDWKCLCWPLISIQVCVSRRCPCFFFACIPIMVTPSLTFAVLMFPGASVLFVRTLPGFTSQLTHYWDFRRAESETEFNPEVQTKENM